MGPDHANTALVTGTSVARPPITTLFRGKSGILAVLAALHLVLFAAVFSAPLPVWDGAWYYVPLVSAWYDHDLQLANNIQALLAQVPPDAGIINSNYAQFITPTGYLADWFSIGPALTWAIPFGAVAAVLGTGGAGGWHPLLFLTTGLTTTTTFLVGMLLCTFWLARRYSFAVAGAATALTWVLSPLLLYAYAEPYYSHVASSTFVVGFMLAWEQTRRRMELRRYVLLGVLAGLMMAMRWQNAIFLVFPLLTEGRRALEAVRGRDRVRLGAWATRVALLAVTTIAGFSPQMAFWWVVYGTPLTIPQGDGFMHWASPEILSTLFASYYNGLFVWEPVAAAGLIGLVLCWRRDPVLVAGSLLVFMLQLYVIASAGDWWGGGGFGPRRFDSLIPLFAFGVAGLLARATRPGRIAAAILAVPLFWVQWVLLTYISGQRGPWFGADRLPYLRETFSSWTAHMSDLAGHIASRSGAIWNDPSLALHPGSPLASVLASPPDKVISPVVVVLVAAAAAAVAVVASARWSPEQNR